MRRRIAATAIGVLLFGVTTLAQQPTVPPTLDFTCYGYVETGQGTRAYNCIPVASQQPQMRTFVPPPGSACNEGVIDEFPPGRIVFQIRCRDDAAPPPVTTSWVREGSGPTILDMPTRVKRIQIEGTYTGYVENFVVWCGVTGDRGGLLVNEILGTSASASGQSYSGIHSAIRSYNERGEHCREIQIEYSVGVDWKVSEVAAPMLLPPMKTEADDAAAVDLARRAVRSR